MPSSMADISTRNTARSLLKKIFSKSPKLVTTIHSIHLIPLDFHKRLLLEPKRPGGKGAMLARTVQTHLVLWLFADLVFLQTAGWW